MQHEILIRVVVNTPSLEAATDQGVELVETLELKLRETALEFEAELLHVEPTAA